MSEELWCVHVRGPDDVLPMPDWEAAFSKAHELNAAFAERHKDDGNTPRMFAAAEPWPWSAAPWSAAGHAAGLRKGNTEYGIAPIKPVGERTR